MTKKDYTAFHAVKRSVAFFLLSLVLVQNVLASSTSLYDVPMQWLEDSGKTVSLDQWKGKMVLITMAYSTCRRTCSVTLKKLEEFQASLDQKKQDVEIVVVSYDPKNDTPQTWSEYRKQRGLNRSNWHFLTGSDRDTKKLSHLLGLADFWSLEGHILHDFKISVLDNSGTIKRQIEWQDLKLRDVL